MLTMSIFSAVFVLLFLFACSIANFFNQLPNCKTATRDAIESSVIGIGYFINFKLLRYKISLLTKSIHELDRTDVDSDQKYIDQDGVPGSVLEVLIAYSLTNVVLHLPNSTTAVRDAIDWIVLQMFSLSKLKTNLKILRNRIDTLREKIDKRDPTRNKGSIFTEHWVSGKVDLLEEGVKLGDEAAHIINHWCRGWCGLHNILNKRVEVMISKTDDDWDLKEEGSIARDAISGIDRISQTLPTAITDFRHYLHFNTNVETLSRRIQNLQHQLNRPPPPPRYRISEEEAQKIATSLETAKNEAVQVIQEVELMHKYWYKRLPGSRYRLSKRVVEMISHVDKVFEACRLMRRERVRLGV